MAGNDIVTVNVRQLVAPAPNTLQKTGTLISQGATTLASGTSSLLTQASDLTPLLRPSLALASLAWSAGTVTATLGNTTIASGTYNGMTGLVTLTLTSDLGIVPGLPVVVSGATGTGSFASIDGEYVAAAGSSGTTLIYKIATSLTMTITGGNVTQTTGQVNGTTFQTTISGATPDAYNGDVLATVTGAGTFTYALAADPGTTPATGAPEWTPYSQGELLAMVESFFAQGNVAAVYVLELGSGTPAAGVIALTAYIADPALQFYVYVLPNNWGGESTAATLANQNTGLTKKVYFLPNLTLGNYTPWKTYKSVMATVQSQSEPTTEFDAAAVAYNILQTDPSNVNKLTPFAFRFLFGVTPLNPNGPTGTTLRTNFLNYVDTGAEGGISNTLLKFGTTMDGRDFAYWYAADWVQIQEAEALANAVINGNNNPTNPLYYNQQGINTLQAVAQGVMNAAVAFGIAAGNPQVTAVPFTDYVKANPSHYEQGIYNGLAVTFTPQTGFKAITFNLTVSDLAAP